MAKTRNNDNSNGRHQERRAPANRWGGEIGERDIDTDNKYVHRAASPRAGRYATLQLNNGGYEVWRCRVGDGSADVVSVHRLLAVAEWGFDAVKDKHVHHENRCTFDNRVENLDPLTPEEHGSEHEGGGEWYTDDELLEWLNTFVSEFGVTPAAQDLKGWPGPSVETYIRRFGSFPKAVRAAGYEPRGRQT